MSETTSPVPLALASPVDQVFPTLTPAQIARLEAHGHVRQVQRGEVLAEAGAPLARCFVVTAGQVELVRPIGDVTARSHVKRETYYMMLSAEL